MSEKQPTIIINNHTIDMAGSEYERRNYICTLIDLDGRETPFNIRIYASDRRIEAEFRPPHEADYDEILEQQAREREEYYEELRMQGEGDYEG